MPRNYQLVLTSDNEYQILDEINQPNSQDKKNLQNKLIKKSLKKAQQLRVSSAYEFPVHLAEIIGISSSRPGYDRNKFRKQLAAGRADISSPIMSHPENTKKSVEKKSAQSAEIHNQVQKQEWSERRKQIEKRKLKKQVSASSFQNLSPEMLTADGLSTFSPDSFISDSISQLTRTTSHAKILHNIYPSLSSSSRTKRSSPDDDNPLNLSSFDVFDNETAGFGKESTSSSSDEEEDDDELVGILSKQKTINIMRDSFYSLSKAKSPSLEKSNQPPSPLGFVSPPLKRRKTTPLLTPLLRSGSTTPTRLKKTSTLVNNLDADSIKSRLAKFGRGSQALRGNRTKQNAKAVVQMKKNSFG